MKTLKEFLNESVADIKNFNNKRIIKKVIDIFSKDRDGKQFMSTEEEKMNEILVKIDEDSTFAEIILNGKFPATSTDDRYGFTNHYNFENTEIIFSSVKNDYMKDIQYTIKVYNKIYSQCTSGGSKKSAECKNFCKVESIAKYYGGIDYL